MSVLVDGYNLLHAIGILPRGLGPQGLEKARTALLNMLAESLDESQCGQTTVVFDASHAPPGLPREITHRNLRVLFAVGYPDADTYIEELIRLDSSPRKLTVVSSDHRLQKAARRRAAAAVDSDVWHEQLMRDRAARRHPPAKGRELRRPDTPTQGEVDYWLREFTKHEIPDDRSDASPLDDSFSIFPPDYGADLPDDPRDY